MEESLFPEFLRFHIFLKDFTKSAYVVLPSGLKKLKKIENSKKSYFLNTPSKSWAFCKFTWNRISGFWNPGHTNSRPSFKGRGRKSRNLAKEQFPTKTQKNKRLLASMACKLKKNKNKEFILQPWNWSSHPSTRPIRWTWNWVCKL